MAKVDLPFELMPDHEVNAEHFMHCHLYRLLPRRLQDATRDNLHLMEYIHCIPVEEVGVPEFHQEPSRKLGDLKNPNIIYPVSDDVFTHIYPDTRGERHLYISVEPTMLLNVDALIAHLEEKLIEMSDEFSDVVTEDERKEALLRCMGIVFGSNGESAPSENRWKRILKRPKLAKVKISPRQLQAVRYRLLRDKIGAGILEPMLLDSYIEDISCSGVGTLFIEHKIFKSLKTAVEFADHEELDEFVLRLSERIRQPVTVRSPIVDATLPDGSRINIVYGRDVSKRGSNFSIRKFTETPLSILDLVGFGSINYTMAAYLSLVLEDGLNMFVCGETASGKTTLMNALTVFIPPQSKIVSVEDTPELQVPHKNWLREVVKFSKQDGSAVGMFDLLKAALRQRPDRIIIGEIRGEEGLIAFQAMQTGHGVMSTFHAASVEKLIQRLVGSPILVPRTYIDNLNVCVIQNSVKLPNGKNGRRATNVSELIGYDSASDSFTFVEAFHWNPATDVFEFSGDQNSYLLEHTVAVKRGYPPEKKRQIYDLLNRRAKVLQKLHKEKGITDFYELLEVLSKAQREGIF